MNALAGVFLFKILATVLAWSLPLLLLPASWLSAAGLPVAESTLPLRLLGWAYLALCLGYGFGLKAALEGRRAMAPIWVGIVSNGGAVILLLAYGLSGHWHGWHPLVQVIAWGSIAAALLITLGLYRFGVRGNGPKI
ncbi:hypothetical protein [Ferrimonas marina]|uniref:Uncharacterized protein n=1 Tax=Ferrimonas marina TaxID=299255 RepID=A0A1M5YT40_9GAMM|nr:hypothetical protein [Ferrimonas marina]SHI15236.1 hypothetical protein SAMN02745129_4408 [Ferrimonas marina]